MIKQGGGRELNVVVCGARGAREWRGIRDARVTEGKSETSSHLWTLPELVVFFSFYFLLCLPHMAIVAYACRCAYVLYSFHILLCSALEVSNRGLMV